MKRAADTCGEPCFCFGSQLALAAQVNRAQIETIYDLAFFFLALFFLFFVLS